MYTYILYGILCHMCSSVTFLMLGNIDDQQLHHSCHLVTLGVQVCLLISWHEHVQYCIVHEVDACVTQ